MTSNVTHFLLQQGCDPLAFCYCNPKARVGRVQLSPIDVAGMRHQQALIARLGDADLSLAIAWRGAGAGRGHEAQHNHRTVLEMLTKSALDQYTSDKTFPDSLQSFTLIRTPLSATTEPETASDPSGRGPSCPLNPPRPAPCPSWPPRVP